MRNTISECAGQVVAKFWLAGEAEAAGDRHDSVELRLEPSSGAVNCIVHVDIGLPVLQPQRAAFRFGEVARHGLVQFLDDPRRRAGVAQALALAALSQAAGMELRASGRSNRDSDRLAQEMQDFQRLLSASGAGSASFAPVRPMREAIEAPADVLETGREAELLQESSEAGIQLASGTNLAFEDDVSALRTIQRMAADAAEHGIPVPEGFSSIGASEAEQALKAIGSPSAAAVCFFGDRSNPKHRYRMQAAEAYPLLAERLQEVSAYRSAIDEGRELATLICADTGMKPSQLRRLAKVESPIPSGRLFEFGEPVRGEDLIGVARQRRYSISGAIDLDSLLSLAKPLDPGWIPRNPDEWQRFLEVSSACAVPLSSGFGIPVQDILVCAKGDWKGFHAGLAASAGIPAETLDRQRLGLATVDTFELIDDFSRSVVLPQILAAIAGIGEPLPAPSAADLSEASDLSRHLVAGKAKNIAGALFEAARKWLSRIPALTDVERQFRPAAPDAEQGERNIDEWPKLINAEFEAGNGAVVRNLASKAQLQQESSRLSHCVARLYLRTAKAGECHIFSVQSKDGGISHSTFEVAPPAASSPSIARADVSIVQHKALRNRAPSRIAFDAAKEWLQAVKEGRLELNLAETADWRSRMKRRFASEGGYQDAPGPAQQARWEGILDMPFLNSALRTAIWGEWRNHIVGRHLSRGDTPEIIFALPETRALLTRMSPSAAARLTAATAKAAP